MILKSFSYKASEGIDYRLVLDSLPLDYINLIVGKNSVGKSTTTHIINNATRMISQKTSGFYGGESDFYFLTKDGKEIRYVYGIENQKIKERLYLEGKEILHREGEKVWIYSFKSKQKIEIKPPEDKLVIQARRDKEEYPIFEKIIEWAENTYLFKFGMLSPEDIKFKDLSLDRTAKFIDKVPYDIHSMTSLEKEMLIKEMAIFGYDLKDISVSNLGHPSNTMIQVYLKNYSMPIFHTELSQGMLRTLFLLIFVNARIREGKTSTLIIDDLCEGLDYQRALELGKLLYKKFQDNNIQLIATSNDRFLMEVIPIQYWNILTREGSTIKTANYQNSKEKFENFMFTGLSNFDLFSSDYLMK